MVATILIACLTVLTVGLAVKYWAEKYSYNLSITWAEYIIVSIIMCSLIIPFTVKYGYKLVRENKLSYYEFWNGWETNAVKTDIRCERDGSCRYNYDCDSYLVSVTYSCGSKGEICTRLETRYHSCPYCDYEYIFEVNSTVGSFLISDHRLPENPQQHRWRHEKSVPQSAIESAGTGIPQFWYDVKTRLESGKLGPVTRTKEYDNYIYASRNTILKKYSSDIDTYIKNGLFPTLPANIYDFYDGNKVRFVGFPENREWEEHLNYFNANYGAILQGDMHLVIVNIEKITNPDSYTQALLAYWQNAKLWGKDSISKNATVVVIGTDGKIIVWARAFTGMPTGNETLEATIATTLYNILFTPTEVLGVKSSDVGKKGNFNNRYIGKLEDIAFGLSDNNTRFKRAHMHGKDGTQGYEYLFSEINVPTSSKIWIILVINLIGGKLWIIALFVNFDVRWRK